MLQIYVAGRYRGPTRDAIELNIQVARHIGRLCFEKGWYPQIPCNNTNHFEHLLPDVDDQVYIEGTLEMMRRCDAVVMIPGWRQSKGAVGEVNEATRLGIPIFYNVDELTPAAEFKGPRYQGHTQEGLKARQDEAGIVTKQPVKAYIGNEHFRIDGTEVVLGDLIRVRFRFTGAVTEVGESHALIESEDMSLKVSRNLCPEIVDPSREDRGIKLGDPLWPYKAFVAERQRCQSGAAQKVSDEQMQAAHDELDDRESVGDIMNMFKGLDVPTRQQLHAGCRCPLCMIIGNTTNNKNKGDDEWTLESEGQPE